MAKMAEGGGCSEGPSEVRLRAVLQLVFSWKDGDVRQGNAALIGVGASGGLGSL